MSDEERLKGLSSLVLYILADVRMHNGFRTRQNYSAIPEIVDLLENKKYIKVVAKNSTIEFTKKGDKLYDSLLERVGEDVDFSKCFNR